MPGLKVGQLAPREQCFVPYAAINKWPYKYLHGEVSRVVSDNYFARGAFIERGWNIFYIRTLLDSTEKPLLLIPQTEVELLFKDINQGLNLGIGFPDVYREPGFRLDFIEEGSPLPRFLGRLSSDCIMAELEVLIPAQGSALEEPENVDDRTLPAFRQKMQGALLASKQKNKAAQDKRRMERIKTRKGLFAELKRSQCYLGLRPRGINQPTNFVANPNLTFEETQQAQEAYELAAGIRLPPLNFSAKAPHQFDRNVVFVCIDIEAYERDSNKLTEIGVCTLDTLDLVNIAPGEVGKKWMEKLRYRHFRVAEYAHLTNKDFVDGCADRFEFGTSEWISIKDAPRVIASCFKAPFSEPGKYTPHPAEARQLHAAGSRKHTQVNESPSHNRNVVLVGHSIRSDIDFMRKVGYDVGNLSNLVEAIDTSNLFRAFKHEQNPRNLGSVLLDFELTGWNLHNAGNDACYTMQAFIAISIAAILPNNKPSVPTSEQLDEAAADAAAKAQTRLKEDMEEWEAAKEEGIDGGDPIKILPAAQAIANQEFERGVRRGQQADRRKEIMRAKEWRNTGAVGGQKQKKPNNAGQKAVPKKPKVESGGPMPFDMDAVDEGMGTAEPEMHDFNGPDTAIKPSSTSAQDRLSNWRLGTGKHTNANGIQKEEEKPSPNFKNGGGQATADGLSQKMARRLQILED